MTAAADWAPPSVSSTVIAKQTGYLAGAIKQGGSYYVYVHVDFARAVDPDNTYRLQVTMAPSTAVISVPQAGPSTAPAETPSDVGG